MPKTVVIKEAFAVTNPDGPATEYKPGQVVENPDAVLQGFAKQGKLAEFQKEPPAPATDKPKTTGGDD